MDTFNPDQGEAWHTGWCGVVWLYIKDGEQRAVTGGGAAVSEVGADISVACRVIFIPSYSFLFSEEDEGSCMSECRSIKTGCHCPKPKLRAGCRRTCSAFSSKGPSGHPPGNSSSERQSYCSSYDPNLTVIY